MILFLTQYYRGLGHSQRINHIVYETSKFLPCIVVNHLLAPPIDWHTDNVFTLEDDLVIDSPIQNIYKTIMTKDRVNNRVKKWIQILDDNPEIKIIVSEGFPFCRHQFAYELIEFMKEAKKRNIMCICSIRDFPWDEPHSDGLMDWIAISQNLVIKEYFSKIFIHGDPRYLPLLPDKLMFANGKQLISNISKYIFYTGYVCNPLQKPHRKRDGNIYISTGMNKEESSEMLKSTFRLIDKYPNKTFTLIQGIINQDEPRIKNNKILVSYIPDLHKKLETCELFITYGGYNSTMEVLNSGCPAIIIPRMSGGKREQLIRVSMLKKYNYFKAAIPASPGNIMKGINEILANTNFPNKCEMNLNGAPNTARELKRIYSTIS